MPIGATMKALFGGNSGATSQPPANPNASPGNQREQQQQNANKVAGNTPAGEQSVLEKAGTEEAPVNPMDKFKEIWQPNTDKDGKVIAAKGREPAFNIDPAKIFEFAGKMDFKKFVKPETLKAIATGGEEGVAAFAQAIQDLGSNTYASSLTASAQLTQKALERQKEQFEASLPELFKKFSLRENLSQKNPALNHPAAKPIIEALQSVMASKYPDASAADLQNTAEEFLAAFASSLSGKSNTDEEEAGGKGGKKEEDWGKFLPEYLQQ